MTKHPTVFITGASSGIGRAAAMLFQQHGWNVAATMRSPEKETTLNTLERVRCYAVDVTKPNTINTAIQQTIGDFGGIDVIVNNAGYGLVGPFEHTTEESVRRQLETNVIGSMNVIRAVLPHLREKRAGTIINITSMGGLITFPYYSVYHATKWAMEGFSESLQFELQPFNIHVKMVEPGAIATSFYTRSLDVAQSHAPTDYDRMANGAIERMNTFGNRGSSPESVAEVILRAARDKSWKQRYPASGNSRAILALRKALPTRLFSALMRANIMRKMDTNA